jgi:hypothetical protein
MKLNKLVLTKPLCPKCHATACTYFVRFQICICVSHREKAAYLSFNCFFIDLLYSQQKAPFCNIPCFQLSYIYAVPLSELFTLLHFLFYLLSSTLNMKLHSAASFAFSCLTYCTPNGTFHSTASLDVNFLSTVPSK